MNTITVQKLNAINQAFYRVTASDFNQTRREPWPGWLQLLPYTDMLSTPASVLDIGCGNGRFGVFLSEHHRIDYHGIDSNSTLLDYARQMLTEANVAFSLVNRDVIVQDLQCDSLFSLVVAFGVLHHVPGYDNRQAFIRQMANWVKPGGLLVFAGWRFYEYERFKRRIIPWDGDLDIETHDYLLDWQRGESALRYCHYIDDAEQKALILASGMQELLTYRADGKTGDMNCYSILRAADT